MYFYGHAPNWSMVLLGRLFESFGIEIPSHKRGKWFGAFWSFICMFTTCLWWLNFLAHLRILHGGLICLYSLLTTLWEKIMSTNGHGIIVFSGRAHCKLQVAFLTICPEICLYNAPLLGGILLVHTTDCRAIIVLQNAVHACLKWRTDRHSYESSLCQICPVGDKLKHEWCFLQISAIMGTREPF